MSDEFRHHAGDDRHEEKPREQGARHEVSEVRENSFSARQESRDKQDAD
ncbi:hypothetical protein O7B34_13215 [Mesorhizobium sp. Cs1299R1N3]